jgi:integrase
VPLKVVRRKSTGALTISGSVAGQRIQRRAASNNPTLAEEEAATLEADILRSAWHGQRKGSRTFADAALSYLQSAPRSPKQQAQVRRLVVALGPAVTLADTGQQTALDLKAKMMRPGHAPGTYVRAVVMPLRAIMHHAHKLGWCDVPHFVVPRENQGRTLFMLPSEAERLIYVAAPHLRPLLLFLLCTGARMSEALELEWQDVDLVAGRAIFWRTKTGRRRVAALPPRVIAALTNLPQRDGRVFRRQDGEPYTDHQRMFGGQIKTAWAGAIKRAGLDHNLTPHDCRHTWASWHYALNKDLLALKQEGGWSSVALVERYAHLLPAGHEQDIRSFL